MEVSPDTPLLGASSIIFVHGLILYLCWYGGPIFWLWTALRIVSSAFAAGWSPHMPVEGV